MALTDPELELLLEVLHEDPGDDVYLQVGEELVRRGRWVDAVKHLSRGLSLAPDEKGWEMLGRAHLEAGDAVAALTAVGRTPREPGTEAARVELLALERSGRTTEARARATELLASDPGDVVAQSLLERLDSPPPAGPVQSPDPTLTVERAERYAVIGRVDRAIRLYRRLVFHNPNNGPLLARLRELAHDNPVADEISRDFTTDTAHLGALPPLVVVPRYAAGVQGFAVEVDLVAPASAGTPSTLPTAAPQSQPPAHRRPDDDPDDEDTDTHSLARSSPSGPSRRRRRSLLNP